MTNIENYRSIAKRQGFEKVPAEFKMCPSLKARFDQYVKETGFCFKPSVVEIPDLVPKFADRETFLKYFNHDFKPGTFIDRYGVAHEPGSAAAFHMKKMHFPMANFDSVEQVISYPFPDYRGADPTAQRAAVERRTPRI